MWNFFGRSHRYCDGLTRRSFMQVGGLGIGGLTLADLNAAELQKPAGTPSSRHKSVIMVYLSGGMPHQDTSERPVRILPEDCRPIRELVGG